MLEKTVTLYFMDDGDLNGRIECTIGNWEGAVYKIPRAKKKWSKRNKFTIRERLEQSGIYFLFGETKSDPKKKTVYVGKADSKNSAVGAWTRVCGKHTKDARKEDIEKGIEIDKWDEAIIVVHAKAASFLGGAGLSYLENKFYWIADDADEAGYYKMLNGNEPNSARRSIRPGDKSEADDFAEHVKTVMRVLGYGDLFKASDEDVDKEDRYMFHMNYNHHRARMKKRVDGFWLQKGSWIDLSKKDSCPGPTLKDRKKHADNINKEDNKLTSEIKFKSASAAAKFVKGTSSNDSRWRNSEGEMVKDLEGKELQDDE